MLISKEDALHSIERLTTEEFTRSVRDILSEQTIEGMMLDVNHLHTMNQSVNAYVRTEDRSYIFSYWKRNGIEDSGITSLSHLEVDILKDLALS
jgi:hypothetical protein